MKKNKGSLTVEACLSLTIFLMVFVTILYIMRIVFAYGIMQHALNQAAKELSTYTYYYAISGLADTNGTIQESTAAGVDSFNQNVSNIVDVYNTFNNLGNGGGSDEYKAFENSLDTASDTIKSIADDPVAALKSVGSVLVNGGNESAKTFIGGELSRGMMAKYIAGKGYDEANARLKSLRIVGGLDGVDLSASKFWPPGAQNEIELVACYTIDPVFPFKVVDKLNFVNKVRVRGWSGKSIF